MSNQDHLLEKETWPAQSSSGSLGITFCLPSRRRFIPNSWLLYVELNQTETELYLYYTHCVVTIVGMRLGAIHDWAASFGLNLVRESKASILKDHIPNVTRIEITEKVSE